MNDQLTRYIGEARWFGGKGREWSLTGVRRVGELPDAPAGLRVAIELAEVTFSDGSTDLYQVPLAFYSEPQERISHALIGEWDDDELGHAHVYDALHDRQSMALWLAAFARHGVAPAPPADVRGELMFHRLPGHDLDIEAHSTLFSGEQSNSSVAFGEDALMKVFRKVTPGVNPDIAIHQVLTEAGSTHVAALYGWLDLVGVQVRLGEEVADAGEAARLGVALAEVHVDLAEHFPVELRKADALGELAGAMEGRLVAALDVVPDLAAHEGRLRETFARLRDLDGVEVQQVHGDLHLGQTLRTVRGWKIVDFEGEPAKPLAERLRPDSVWRDVAGMVRSFDYAPRVVAMTGGADAGGEAEQRSYRASEWAERNRAAFLAAYTQQRGEGLDGANGVLLEAYLADKVVYEAVYEARNRPGWLAIPLAALEETS